MQLDAGATVSPAPVVRYCLFRDLEGYAIRDGSRRTFFCDHDAQFVLLSDVDMAHLTLLGLVQVVEEQHILDALAAGVGASWTQEAA